MTNPAPAKVDHSALEFPDHPAVAEPSWFTESTIPGLTIANAWSSPEGAGIIYWHGATTGVLEWVPSNNLTDGGVKLSDLGIPSSSNFLLNNTPNSGLLVDWVLASLPAVDVSQVIMIQAAGAGYSRPVSLYGIPGLTLQAASAASSPSRPVRYNYYAIVIDGVVETRIQITAFQFSRSSETGKEYLSVTSKTVPEGLSVEAIIHLWEIAHFSDGSTIDRNIAEVVMDNPIQASAGPTSASSTISGNYLRDYEYRGLEFQLDNLIKEGETADGVYEFRMLGGYFTRIFPGDVVIMPDTSRYTVLTVASNGGNNSVGTTIRGELL